jgi:NhaP-type Na+/H+ or K+/H+ antiporter
MYLACVLCPTDTVAAVGLVKEKYFPKLNAVLFGESVINDAISILLFSAIERFFGDENS